MKSASFGKKKIKTWVTITFQIFCEFIYDSKIVQLYQRSCYDTLAQMVFVILCRMKVAAEKVRVSYLAIMFWPCWLHFHPTTAKHNIWLCGHEQTGYSSTLWCIGDTGRPDYENSNICFLICGHWKRECSIKSLAFFYQKKKKYKSMCFETGHWNIY